MIAMRIVLAVFVAAGAGYLASAELEWGVFSSILLALIILAVYGLTELEIDRVSPEEEEPAPRYGSS